MALMGRPAGPTRRPISPLDSDALDRLKSALDRLGILADEPNGWSG